MALLWLLLLLLVSFLSSTALECSESKDLQLLIEDRSFALSNGFVCLEGSAGIITKFSADRSGGGQYGANTLKGIQIITEGENGNTCSSDNAEATTDVSVEGMQDNVKAVMIMKGIKDCSSTVEEEWTLELKPMAQGVSFTRRGSTSATSPTGSVIRRQWDMSPSSITAWYESNRSTGSVVQMKAAETEASHFASKIPLRRVYTLGGSGDEEGQVGNVSLDILFGDADKEFRIDSTTVLVSRNDGDKEGWSGFQEVLVVGFPTHPEFYDHWTSGWKSAGIHDTAAEGDGWREKRTWSTTLTMFAHDLDYPVGTLGGSEGSSTGVTKGSNLPDDDLHAFMTGIYASPVGCLCTHVSAVEERISVGQIATTIARPDRGYAGTYNYFDPDNYINTAALLWSGDRFLQEQVRMVVERSGDFLGGDGAVDAGQLPHHFEGTTPVFQALSGEVQTGPNIFWILTALNYAKSAQNYAWLRGYMPKLRVASNFLFNLLQEIPPLSTRAEHASAGETLASVPGSLMIDVFLRNNFTTDTNAMLVGFFQEFAAAEEYVGNNTGAERLRSLSDGVKRAMNNHLWCRSGDNATCSAGASASASACASADEAAAGDHFVTQWNGVESMDTLGAPTDASYRDLVDYDSNLIAVAHGIPTDSDDGFSGDDGRRARRILARIDGNTASGSGGQCRASSSFVSERYYGPDDCTDGNTGDSWCAMGRVGWFDALSRRAVGDVKGFDSLLLEPLKRELLSTTWMHERLNCDGSQMLNRTAMYFEYPSVTAMFVRSIRYGIDFGYGRFSVAPFIDTTDMVEGPSFSYDINGVQISFRPEAVRLDIPLGGERERPTSMKVSISSVLPSEDYLVTTPDGAEARHVSNSQGQLDFSVATTTSGDRLRVDAVALI